MNKTKRLVSLLLAITLIIGMLPTSVFATTQENNTVVGDDNIPKNNVRLLFSDKYLNGTEGITSYKLELSKYLNADGVEIQESIDGMYGNLLYATCYSNDIQDGDYLYSYFKDCRTGNIIYAHEGGSRYDIEINAIRYSDNYSSKELCDLISIRDEDGKYDIINTITCQYYDYNLKEEISELVNGYAIVYNGTAYGLMGADGKLVYDFEYDQIRQDKTNKYIAAWIYSPETVTVFNTETREELSFDEFRAFTFTENGFVIGHLKKEFTQYHTDKSYSESYGGFGIKIFDADFNLVSNECYKGYTEFGDSLLCSKPSDLVYAYTPRVDKDEYNYDLITSDGNVIDLASKFNTQAVSLGVNGSSVKVTAYSAKYYVEQFGYKSADNVYEMIWIDGYVDLEVGFSGLLDTKGNIIADFTEETIVEPYTMVWRNGEEVPLTVTVNGVTDELQIIKYVVFGEMNGAFYFRETNYGEDSVTYLYSVFDHNGNKISTLSGESESAKGFLFYNGKQMLFGDYYYDIQTRKKIELSSIIGEHTRIVERTDTYLLLRTEEGKNYALYFPETNTFISGFTDYDDYLYEYKTTDFVVMGNASETVLYHKDGRLLQNISSNDDIIVLDNGNVIVTDSNSSYSLYSCVTGEKLDGSTNSYVEHFADDAGNRIVRSSDGKYGLLSANGNIIIEPTYTSQIDYKNFGIYKISRALVDMYGNVILSGEDDSSMYRQDVINRYYNLSNSGTILAEESHFYGEEDSYVVFLLDEIIRNQNTKEQTDNMSVFLNKDIIALGETTTAFVTDASGKFYEYDGNYTVSCTDSTIVDIKTQGTGIVCATITGKVIGEAVLTFTFDDGTEVSGKITVDLSTENILEHFPQVVNNNKYTKIFGEAINNCHQTINTYSDFDAAIISYFTSLKSGGAGVISRHILGKIGLVPDQRDEYVDAAVKVLMNEICNYDSIFEDSLNAYLGKWSTAKAHYTATNESLKEFAKYASSISNFSESDILVCASEITSAYGKTVDVAGDAIDIYEILAVIICTESLHIDIVNDLLDVVSPESDLYEGLERLKVELSSGLAEKVVKEYIQGKLVEKIAKGIQSAANNFAAKQLLGIKSISKLTLALSKICIELIVDEYSDAGGIMASDLTKAIYLTTFATQLEYALKDEQLKYALGTVEDSGKLKRLYNAYIASICVALESCASICKSEYSYLKDEALKFKNLIAHRCTFEMFMDACKKEAIKQYPTDYAVSINDTDQLVVTGTYQPMGRTFSLRSAEPTVQNDILYIPSVIDGKKVVSIEANAFRNNEAIKGVIIADGINIIGDYAFAGCVNLEYVIMGSVSEVGEGAFSDCCNLEFVTLPENLLEIKQYTFQNCSELKSVTIPESVLTISDDAFLNTSVADLVIRSKETNISLNSGLTPSSIFGVQNDSANALAEQLEISVSLMDEIAESISVFKAPENTSYICGEEIDTAGLVLQVDYADRTEYIETDYAVDYSDAPGNQKVNIYYAGRQTSFEVYFQPISIERIDITSLKTTLAIGESIKLDVAISPNNATLSQLLWSSSNEDILIVKDGLVIANSVGEATITVCDTSTGVTGDLTIKVVDNEEVEFEEDQLTKLVYKKITHSGNYLFSCSQSSYSISVYDMDMQLIGRGYESVQLYLDKDVVIVVNRYKNSNPDKTTLYTTKYADATNIEIRDGETITGYNGAKHTLSVRFHPDNSIEETINWSTSDPSVATVDDRGEVSFVSTGEVIITATTDSGLSDSITITVIECPKILLDEDVILNTSTNSGTALFKFVPDEDGTYLFYSFDNEFDTYGYLLDASMQVIDSDDDGGDGSNFRIEYSMTAGTTYYLKAKPHSLSYSGTYHITVARLIPATSIEITAGDSISRYEGSYYYLSAKFSPDNAITERLTWTSSNTDVATVTNGGYVNFIAAGTATITVTSEKGLTDSIEVVVKAPTVMTVGETKTGFADLGCTADIFEFTPTEDGVYRVTVDSPNYSYLNLRDSEGNYLANKSGYDMTADQAMTAGSTYCFEMAFADPNLSGNFTIKVEKLVPATGMEIVQGEMISGYEGGGYWSLSTKFTPDNAAPESVTWTSSDPLVATVDDLGRVNYVAAGTVTITATSQNGHTDTITVVVKAYPVLTEETPCDVTIENNEDVYIRFVPETSGNYRIYYTNLSYDGNRPHFVLEQNNSWLKQGDEYLDCYLEADTEYLIGTWFSSYSPPGNGSYTVCIAEIGAAESMQIDQGDAASGFKGEIIHLSTTFSPETCMQESVSWTSSNNEVATVAENGRVNMLSVGTAIITATSENGLTDTITITVKGYPAIQEGTETDALIDIGGMSSYFSFTPEEDGYYAFYASTNSDTLGYIMDEELNILASDDDNGEGNNFKVKYQMEAGKTYILKAMYYGSEETGTIKVCIEKTRYIASLEVTALPTRLDYVKEHVYNISYKGLKLKATWSDGSVSNWSCNSDGYFNNMIEDEYISFDTDNCETSGEIIVSCGGQTTSFHINLVDNPVDHIEVVSPSSHKYIENYNGDEMYGGGYYYYTNTPTDAVIKIVYLDGSSITANVGDVVDYYSIDWEHNQYETPWVVGTENESTVTYLGHTVNLPITVEKNKVESIEVVSGKVTCIENAYGYDMGNGYYYYYSVPSDVTVKVNYTDGSSITANIHDDLDGYSFNWTTDQYSDPWTLGDDNYVTISYLGVTGKLPVSVITSPVERIEINTAPTREYIYGDSEWGWLYSNGGYEFYPSDMTGISFTVHYTDGTTKTFTSADIDDQHLINGYGYSLSYDEYISEPGDFPVTFSYMGKSAEYTIKLKESTVESLSVTKLPSTTQLGNYFSPDFVGTEFTITFTDGSTKTVILTESNLEYEYDWDYGLTYKVNVDGNTLSIRPIYAESGIYYRAYYIDQTVEIRDFTFVDSQDVTSIVLGNVTSLGDNMNVTVTYDDGSTDNLRLDVVAYNDYGNKIEGYAKTAKGLLYYSVETKKDSDGNITGYEVYILEQDVEVEATSVLSGDVNSDGTVDSLDRVILSRYLANWEGYSADIVNMDAADVNNDRAVDSLDRLILSRYLANWLGYENLPFAS